METFKAIFRDHYEEFEYTCHPRDVELDNIDRMLNCGDPAFGGAMYCCRKCGYMKFVPFHCHSRFCPSCGTLYAIRRTTAMSFKLVRTTHRHCVFTIAEDLRHFFLEDRSLLNCLFHAVNSVISRLFFNMNKSRHFVPGFICVLHTFGRDLKWNPHIHVLLSEGAVDKDGKWRNISHFNYKFLRNAFQTALLNELEAHIGPSFKKTKAKIYRSSVNGFYVYAKPRKCHTNEIIKYIGRYLGRPVIATSRIDSYDTSSDTVTFHYNRHEDDKYIVETVSSIDFIKRLVRHIPEKNFKMIRYYGIYARHRASDNLLIRAISHEKRRAFLSFTTWRGAILSAFGYDPISCPMCRSQMDVLDIYYNRKRVSLQELYKKACRKYRMKHPPPVKKVRYSYPHM